MLWERFLGLFAKNIRIFLPSLLRSWTSAAIWWSCRSRESAALLKQPTWFCIRYISLFYEDPFWTHKSCNHMCIYIYIYNIQFHESKDWDAVSLKWRRPLSSTFVAMELGCVYCQVSPPVHVMVKKWMVQKCMVHHGQDTPEVWCQLFQFIWKLCNIMCLVRLLLFWTMCTFTIAWT